MSEPERIDRRRTALIAYDVCRRALTPPDPARKATMRPVLDAWVRMIATARATGVPVIYTTPVSRADGTDVVMLPTDLSAETGVPPLEEDVILGARRNIVGEARLCRTLDSVGERRHAGLRRKVGRQHDDVGAIGAADWRRVDHRHARRPCGRDHLHPGIEHGAHRSPSGGIRRRQRAPANVVSDQRRPASIDAFGFGHRNLLR